MTEPGTAIEARCRIRHWHHWILWWKVGSDELQAASLFAARRLGAVLAAVMAGLTARFAYAAMPYGPSLSVNADQTMLGMCLAAFSLGWLALGLLLMRGWRWAVPGLLALCTVEFLAVEGVLVHVLSICWSVAPLHARGIGFGLLLIPLWTIPMHAYAVAYRAAQGEARTA